MSPRLAAEVSRALDAVHSAPLDLADEPLPVVDVLDLGGEVMSNEPTEHADAVAVIRHYESTPERHVSEFTVSHDQGWVRSLINNGINGSESLSVATLRMEPHQVHPLHAHANTDQLYFVVAGRAEMTVGDRSEWVEQGTVIYVPRDAVHGTRTEADGVTLLLVYPIGDRSKIEKRFVE